MRELESLSFYGKTSMVKSILSEKKRPGAKKRRVKMGKFKKKKKKEKGEK
jgi:hypothetical protein